MVETVHADDRIPEDRRPFQEVLAAGEETGAMVQTTTNSTPLEDREGECDNRTWSERFSEWLQTEFIWYAGSFTFHLLALCRPAVAGQSCRPNRRRRRDGTLFNCRPPEPPKPPPDIINDSIVKPEPPPEENHEEPPLYAENQQNESAAVTAIKFDDEKVFVMGGNHTSLVIPGAARREQVRLQRQRDGTGCHGFAGRAAWETIGTATNPSACAGRETGRAMAPNVTRAPPDASLPPRNSPFCGRWTGWRGINCPTGIGACGPISSVARTPRAPDPGSVDADAAATAMGLLPFLAHGETHKSYGKHAHVVANGLVWLVRHQKPDGDLSAGAESQMYAHALATHRAVRGLRNDGGQTRRRGGPGRGRFHRRRAKRPDRRLALSSRRRGGHLGPRLADHGPEERADWPG